MTQSQMGGHFTGVSETSRMVYMNNTPMFTISYESFHILFYNVLQYTPLYLIINSWSDVYPTS